MWHNDTATISYYETETNSLGTYLIDFSASRYLWEKYLTIGKHDSIGTYVPATARKLRVDHAGRLQIHFDPFHFDDSLNGF